MSDTPTPASRWTAELLRARAERTGMALAAPALAVLLTVVVAFGVLQATGADAGQILSTTWSYGTSGSSLVAVLNKSVSYYLAGLAGAIGFRMLLFNIGIDGQYRLGVFAAAVVGAAVTLPPVLHVGLEVVVAMAVGAAWAWIPGYLKTSRGVSEVISTIMLNAVATGLVAYMLTPGRLAVSEEGSNNLHTPDIAASGWMPGIDTAWGTVHGFALVAAVVGLAYGLVLSRTRFGFELRASGMSPRAAAVGGIDTRRMILTTIMVSGAMSGLIGLPELLGSSHRYGLDFPAGLGWTGLSVALIGRNHPVGVAVGALLWAWLERCAQPLELVGVPKEVVTIMQGVIVLAVVVAYEVIRRVDVRRQQRLVGRAEADDPDGPDEPEPVASGAVAS